MTPRGSACPTQEELRAFRLNTLAPEAFGKVAAHLGSCPACRTSAGDQPGPERLRPEAVTVDSVPAVPDPPSARVSPAENVTNVITPGGGVSTPSPTVWSQPALPVRQAGSGLTRTGPSAEHSVMSSAADPPSLGSGAEVYSLLRPPEAPDEIGRLGEYRVLRRLSEGGMGYVFLAEDVTLLRPVALKVMKPAVCRDESDAQRFLREARHMAAIKHEHLVVVYRGGQENSLLYLAMELLKGETLADRLARGPVRPVAELVRIGAELADGLAAVHGHGLVHRDVKPSNVWLESPRDRVKVLDFGLARMVEGDGQLTTPGMVMGTPAFMSPEQARGMALDPRSDVFSLGAVLYCMCTGTQPFHGNTPMDLMISVAVARPKPADEVSPDIPGPLSDLIDAMIQKDPAGRPESAAAVADKLRAIDPGPDTVPGPVSRARISTARGGADTTLAATGAFGRRPGWRRIVAAAIATLLLAVVAAVVAIYVPQKLPPVPRYPEVEGAVYLDAFDIDSGRGFPFTPAWFSPLVPVFTGPDGWPPPAGGRRVVIDGQPCKHGIFMHITPELSPPVCRVVYRLDKGYRLFSTRVTLCDGPPRCSPMTFRVRDAETNRVLWESPPVTGHEEEASGDVPVAGVRLLSLELSVSDIPNATHGGWIDPYVKK